MEPNNPYQAPHADISTTADAMPDQTSPFSPQGRFGRLSYIAWVTVIQMIAMVILAALGGASMFGPIQLDPAATSQTFETLGLVTLISFAVLSIIVLVISTLFVIRRLHDFNASGWWCLLLLVPLANIVLALVLLFKGGTPGGNLYGGPRFTPTWEKVVGFLGILFFVISLIGSIIPAYLQYMA